MVSPSNGKFGWNILGELVKRVEGLDNKLEISTGYVNFFFFLIQFNVPFKIISLIETSQSIGGRNGSTQGKPPDTTASRTWLVSHVASAGLEPTPVTAVR